MLKKHIHWIVAFTVCSAMFGGVALAGADSDNNDLSERIQSTYNRAQPIEEYPWSQMRQTLIEIERAQIQGGPSTSFFFARGGGFIKPVHQCASIADPIPSSYSLSNPWKLYHRRSQGAVAISQIEPNGVFTGDSDGTNTICLTPKKAKPYKVYGELDAFSVTVAAHWDEKLQQVVVDDSEKVFSTFTVGNK